MSEPVPELSVVIVSFNTRDLLERCLRAIPAGAGALRSQVIVVDNASADGSAAMLRGRFPEIRLIESGSNLGFAKATNLGTRASAGRVVAWLNSDCLVSPGSLEVAGRYLEERPKVGAVGPLILYPDGRVQPSAQAFPSVSRVVWHFLGARHLLRAGWVRALAGRLGGLLGPMSRGYLDAHERATAPRAVDWVSGACLLTRRDVLDRVGGLDEAYFMYCEDTDWCRRARDAGYAIHQLPSAHVVHHVGASRAANPWASFHYYRSLLLYFRRYQARRFGWARGVMACGAVVNGAFRALRRRFRPEPGPNPWWAVLRCSLRPEPGDALPGAPP